MVFDLSFFGLVAQMGDRRLGMAEAPGSNPGLCANRDNVEPENKAIFRWFNIVKGEFKIMNSPFCV